MKFTIKKTGLVIQAIPCSAGWKDIESNREYSWNDLEPFREARTVMTSGAVHGIGMKVNIGVSMSEKTTQDIS